MTQDEREALIALWFLSLDLAGFALHRFPFDGIL